MPALEALSEEYRELVMSLDAALSTKYKNAKAKSGAFI